MTLSGALTILQWYVSLQKHINLDNICGPSKIIDQILELLSILNIQIWRTIKLWKVRACHRCWRLRWKLFMWYLHCLFYIRYIIFHIINAIYCTEIYAIYLILLKFGISINICLFYLIFWYIEDPLYLYNYLHNLSWSTDYI